jgi:uncharacterized membrane protein
LFILEVRRGTMQSNERNPAPTVKIALASIMTAITALLTLVVRVPVPATEGYVHLGDVAIYFLAFTFGPITACIAGGLGTALADLVGGAAQWAPFSLVIHGLQGFVAALIAGTLARETRAAGRTALRWILAGITGTVILCGGYLIAGTILKNFATALVELPWNAAQGASGLIGGIPLTLAVQKAYPPVRGLRW